MFHFSEEKASQRHFLWKRKWENFCSSFLTIADLIESSRQTTQGRGRFFLLHSWTSKSVVFLFLLLSVWKNIDFLLLFTFCIHGKVALHPFWQSQTFGWFLFLVGGRIKKKTNQNREKEGLKRSNSAAVVRVSHLAVKTVLFSCTMVDCEKERKDCLFKLGYK